jgi:hypothetical protein
MNIEIVKTPEAPKIDGVLDDPVWKRARGYSEFISFYPEYGKPIKEKTIVYSAYDADNLYFAFQCYDREPDKIIATVHKRDGKNQDDKVAVFIDSHNDSQNAYYLQSNPLGIQTDGIVDPAGFADKSQDFVWDAAGKKNADGYSVEFRVPFKTLRFPRSKSIDMGVNFLRKISRHSEQYTIPGVKYGEGSILGQYATLRLEDINYRRLFDVLPVVTYMNRRERDESDRLVAVDDKRVHLGLTSKIGITSEMTLDVTLNPDFSHIESDEGQVDVNLRVDALYEEKRPFFLEGLEHFNFAGTGFDTPIELIVHTRNISDPVLGMKLSGKIGKSGVVNSLFAIDEARKNRASNALAAENVPGNDYYGIFRYKHLLGNDSYIGSIYTGKEFSGGYRRLGGLDSRIRINGTLSLDTFYLYSFKKDPEQMDKTDASAHGGKLNYESRYYWGYLGYYDLAKGFHLDPGRSIRDGIRIFSAYLERYFYFSSEVLKRISVGYTGNLARDKYSELNEYKHSLFSQVDFSSSTWVIAGYDFATEVYEGKIFDRDGFYIMGQSQVNKYIFLRMAYSAGGLPYYSQLTQGDVKRLFFSVTLQPTKKFSSEFTLTRHIFHDRESGEERYDIVIYRNKTVYQVNKYLSLRGIVEYNSQEKKMISDVLVEFTYIPGTVFHLGYGPTFTKIPGAGNLAEPYDRFRVSSSTLFFKASYLFRF